MRVTVIGGTGLIGDKLVARLRAQVHDTVVAARSTGVDLVTGAGLAHALADADAVVDVSNAGDADPVGARTFFARAGANLAAAARAAGVAHIIALSAVGASRFDSGYFRAKKAQEETVAASGLSFTIVRATPFFEFIYNLVDANGAGDTIRVPPVLMQPIAADDVAAALLRAVSIVPANEVVEIAGPETWRLPVLAEEVLTANEDPRRIVVDPGAPYFGATIGAAELIGGARPCFATTRFEDWLRLSLAA
jgi:uncharacterized protein YbjT (DUF2867 family)